MSSFGYKVCMIPSLLVSAFHITSCCCDSCHLGHIRMTLMLVAIIRYGRDFR